MRWGDSKISIPQFRGEKLEVRCHVVYIDGEHSYQGTVADIRAFAPLAACGAKIVIDDIGQDSASEQIARACRW